MPRLKQSALALTSIAVLISEEVSQKLINFLKRYEVELQNMQRHDVKADVLLCILSLLQKDPVNIPSKIHMKKIKEEFEQKFSDDYSERKEKGYSGISYPSTITISAKKIGIYVRDLGIKTGRDGHGFYIPCQQEGPHIEALAERYGFDEAFLKKANEPEPDPLDQFSN